MINICEFVWVFEQEVWIVGKKDITILKAWLQIGDADINVWSNPLTHFQAVHTQHSKLQIVGTSFDILSVAWCVWRWVRVTSSRVLNDQNSVIPALWHSVSDSVWLWMPECHAKSSGEMEKYFM